MAKAVGTAAFADHVPATRDVETWEGGIAPTSLENKNKQIEANSKSIEICAKSAGSMLHIFKRRKKIKLGQNARLGI